MTNRNALPTLDDLEDQDPQTIADGCGVPILWADHQATRRQRLHGVNVPDGQQTWTSTHLNECLQHLDAEGYNEAIFICETPKRTHLACYIQFFPIPRSPT
jgi:hypothetical protein